MKLRMLAQSRAAARVFRLEPPLATGRMPMPRNCPLDVNENRNRSQVRLLRDTLLTWGVDTGVYL